MAKQLKFPCYFMETGTHSRFIVKDTAAGTAVLLFTSEGQARRYKQYSELTHRISSIAGDTDLLAFLDTLPHAVTHAVIDIAPEGESEQVIRLSDLQALLAHRVISRL